LLRIVFPLLGVGLEIATGLLFYAGVDKLGSTMPLLRVHGRLESVENGMIVITDSINRLKTEPEELMNTALNAIDQVTSEPVIVNEPKVEVDTDRVKARRLIFYLIMFIIGLFIMFSLIGKAMAFNTEIIAVDLSGSEKTIGYDKQTEFDKNLRGVDMVVGSIEPDTMLYILGINATSFSFPFVILKAKTSKDKGYFNQNIKRQRGEILREWHRRKAELKPDAEQTDVFGMLRLVSSIFKNNRSGAGRLFIFSDMRHSKGSLNLERMERIKPTVIDDVAKNKGIYNLKGVDVYVYGVHAGGKTDTYWDGLHQLWGEYFRRAGAQLKAFSNMREVRR
jgi:hypothetical protein